MTKAIRSIRRRLREVRLARLAVIPFVLAVAGCAADDIELNGSIFNAVGLNQKSKAVEPKLAERAPLVMPPDLQRVPDPGTPDGVGADVAALNDPDARVSVSRAELERQQAEYCKKNYELAKAHGDNDADQATGPLGPCRGSVLTAIKNWNAGSGEDE